MTVNNYNPLEAAKGQAVQQANLRKIAEKPILVKPSLDYGKWISYDQYRLDYPDIPYFTRQILPNELVYDFDREWSDNAFNCQKLINTLKHNNIPHSLAYSGGKGLHVDVFFDMNSLTIDPDVISKANEELVDINKNVRVAIWNKLLEWAKIDRTAANLDFGKVNFNSNKKGSMLRDFGTPRNKNGVITFKTLLDDIPEKQPTHEELVLRFPDAPVMWDVSHLTSDIEKAIQYKTKQYNRSTIDVSLEGVGISEVYCVQKLIKNGIQQEAPHYYAAYSIARCCHDLGLSKEQADANVSLYIDRSDISDDEHRTVIHDNALNGYDMDTHHLSCSSIKDNYGEEYCNKSCVVFQKRRDARLIEKGATTKVEQELFTAMGEFPGPLQMAQKMQEKHPIYYDKTRSYWLWLHDEKRYMMVDETDILNAIHRVTKMNNLVQGKVRSEILTSIQMTGRQLNPKEPNKNWIQFKDHCVDVRTKDSIDPTPEYLFTSRIPHKVGDTQDTPYIDKLFTDWVGEENKQMLYEICAYCMLSDYPIHRMFWFVGSGRNGKDQFIELINRLVGRDNCTATDLERIADSRFESSKLYKKLVGCVGETDYGVLRKTNLLKALTGGSPISGEYKNKTPFDFWNYAKIIIASNSIPIVEDKTDGWFARNILIDFPNKFAEGNDVLGKITEKEYERLCRKCVNILPDLLKKGVFTNELSLLEKRKEYENKSNPIGQFINEQCEEGVNYIIPFWHLFEVLTDYLEQKGLRTYTKTVFRRELKAMEYELKSDHSFTEYTTYGRWTAVLGLQLKNSPYEMKVSEKSSYSAQSVILRKEQEACCADKTDKTDYTHSAAHVGIESEGTPFSPHTPQASKIDQSIQYFENVKKEVLNSININDFILMVKKTHPELSSEHIKSYLIKIGKITNNGDKSCVECGEPGKHRSSVVVDRNTDRIEYRCDACYEQYQQGKVDS